jgi:DNA mismatch repair ATPase MutS
LSRSIPGFVDYMRFRFNFPRAVILVRVGALYSAIGFDAVVLMEHCGAAAKAAAKRSPCAMINPASLRRTLNQLVQAGFTVVRGGGGGGCGDRCVWV